MEIVLKESNPNDSFATSLRELTGGNVSERIQQLVHSISSDVERIQSASSSASGHQKMRQEVLQVLTRKAVYVMFQIHLIDSLKPTIQSLSCFLSKLLQTLSENDHVQIFLPGCPTYPILQPPLVQKFRLPLNLVTLISL